ncbi:hypothetical protein QWM81_03455 [Streptomyces ficellus]|uniref:Integral membrane protein n=1 Tax=Streptomyces ficellus TaxID=1977088 RepID=A0ABT7Z0U9_9ACTN|nr:hypothetical protein [Streptomyces ficellus]MDN3293118.1 hypothetical protein [Streptomyces ficellus]
MYGPGPGIVPPQPRRPSTTAVVVLRVVFALLPLLSIGFLTWATTLRLAIVTRKALDWALFALSVVFIIVGLAFTTDDIDSLQMDLAMGGIILNAAVFTGYFLYADLRHYERRYAEPAPNPYAATFPQQTAGYGYPQPYGHTPQPHLQPPIPPQPHLQPEPQLQAPAPAPIQPQPQPQPPAPAKPPSHRIDQVRAELDELSDLLRKEEDK